MDNTNYTYDEFLKALEASGLQGGFSPYDMNLAQQNPTAGMQILQAKQNWQNAGTEAERLAANALAEQVRGQYGSYSGGADGSLYNALGGNGGTQSSFPGVGSPTGGYPESGYAGDIQTMYRQTLDYPEYQDIGPAPTYQSRHDADYQAALYSLLNRPEFAYEAAQDPLYSQYRKQYLREGKRAAEDTMGAAAAMTGGIPSSYAVTAAGQAANYYNAQLTDKIPELYQQAYNRYLSQFQMDAEKLAAIRSAEQDDWDKYLTELGQHNADRTFRYNQYMDRYNMLANNLATAQGLEGTDYERYLKDLNNRYQLAQMAANAGDLSYLQALGIDTSNWWTLNGPRASGGGGGGGGSGKGKDTILATLKEFGTGPEARALAEEYLLSLGLAQWEYNKYMGLLDSWYETEKDNEFHRKVAEVGPSADTRGQQSSSRLDQLAMELAMIQDLETRKNRILFMRENGQISREEAEMLFDTVLSGYKPRESAGTSPEVVKPNQQHTR